MLSEHDMETELIDAHRSIDYLEGVLSRLEDEHNEALIKLELHHMDKMCCSICHTHTTPHYGCILR